MRCGLLVVAVAGVVSALGSCGGKKDDNRQPIVAPAMADAAPAPVDLRPERVVITAVTIRTIDPPKTRELYVRELAQELGLRLTNSEWFARASEDVPDTHRARKAKCVVTIRYHVVKRRETLVAVEMALEWEDGGDGAAPSDNVVLTRPLTRKDLKNLDGIIAEQVVMAVAAASAGVTAKEELRAAPPEKILAVLDAVDLKDDATNASAADLALWALTLARERRMKQAYDRVVRLLESSNEDLRQASVGTLIALRDQRAVAHIAKTVQRGDPLSQRIAIDAIGALGGEDAVEYLEHIASGSSDPEIAEQARAALARVKARASIKAP